MAGFAAAYGLLYLRTDRDRVGFHGPLVGVVAGLVAVALGLHFAFGSPAGSLISAHYRLNLLGFLGLTIVGVTYQFYPPTVGRFPGAGDRLALLTIALFAGGLVLELGGALAAEVSGTSSGGAATLAVGSTNLATGAVTLGHGLALVGALGYAYLVLGLFVQRARE